MKKSKPEIIELLNTMNIDFEMIEHQAVFTIEDITALHLPKNAVVAKNLFVRDDKKRNYYLIALCEDKKVNFKSLQEKIGSRKLSFASEKDLNALLGLKQGAVSPFGILNDQACKVQVLIDTFFCDSLIGIHPNENTATVWLKTEDLIKLIQEHGNAVDWVEI